MLTFMPVMAQKYDAADGTLVWAYLNAASETLLKKFILFVRF